MYKFNVVKLILRDRCAGAADIQCARFHGVHNILTASLCDADLDAGVLRRKGGNQFSKIANSRYGREAYKNLSLTGTVVQVQRFCNAVILMDYAEDLFQQGLSGIGEPLPVLKSVKSSVPSSLSIRWIILLRVG